MLELRQVLKPEVPVNEDQLSAAYRMNPPAAAHLTAEMFESLVEGTLPAPEREAAQDHVTRCEMCAKVYQGLLAFERESGALRAPAASPLRARRSPFYWPASIAALLVMGVAAALFFRPPPAPLGEDPATPAATASRPEPIELLPVRVSEARALILRSPGRGSEAFLAAFNQAIEPYRSEHFPEAAERLVALGTRFPDAPEPPLYEGVARLMSNNGGAAAAAIALLDRAAQLAKGSEWQPDAEYYAARARLAGGREDEGRQTLVRLCVASGPYQAQACRAVGRRTPGRDR